MIKTKTIETNPAAIFIFRGEKVNRFSKTFFILNEKDSSF